jgi:hypothetical protein
MHKSLRSAQRMREGRGSSQEPHSARLRLKRGAPWLLNSPSPPSTAKVTVATNFWEVPMKTVIEGNQEATKALALAGVGVIIAMLLIRGRRGLRPRSRQCGHLRDGP